MSFRSCHFGCRSTETAERIFARIPAGARGDARDRLLSHDAAAAAPYLGGVQGSDTFVSLVREKLVKMLRAAVAADESAAWRGAAAA